MSRQMWDDDTSMRSRPANVALLSPVSFLERPARVFPDHVAVICEDRSEVWREQARVCGQFATALRPQKQTYQREVATPAPIAMLACAGVAVPSATV